VSATQDTVYANPAFRDIDIGAVMRIGHPGLEEGDRYILDVVAKLRQRLGRPLRILDVGSGSGHLTLLLARAHPDCQVIANEIEPAPIEQARAKLEDVPNASVFAESFEDWHEKVDVVISWGTHHHLAHGYLDRVREILAPDGIMVIGDEFCPEYLTADDQARLAKAPLIEIVDGLIFDDAADIDAYRATGTVPEWNSRIEEARRRALWTWYKHVGDYAIEKDCWTVLITELQIARDDLITDFAEEHKTSPYLLERELELNRFSIGERMAGPVPPELQSVVLYTCWPSERPASN
jgi:cyclopropane fatty-acyl-phospholipid synthase-like methyltransferase